MIRLLPTLPPKRYDEILRELEAIAGLATDDKLEAAQARLDALSPAMRDLRAGEALIQRATEHVRSGIGWRINAVRDKISDQKDSMKNRRMIMRAGAGLAGVLGLFSLISVWWVLNARGSERWPSVPGHIERAFVGQSCTSGSVRDGISSCTQDVRLRYRYAVDGRDFVGERAGYGNEPGCAGSDECGALAQRYRDHPEVTVYYKPGAPDRAVLYPGSSSDTEITPYFFAAAGAVGLFLLFFSLEPLALRIGACLASSLLLALVEWLVLR